MDSSHEVVFSRARHYSAWQEWHGIQGMRQTPTGSAHKKELDSGMHSRVDTSYVQMSGSKVLRSGALGKAVGLSADTIRHYERIGVLPRASRTEAGYRVYPDSSVERVLIVQRALRIGFSLSELAEVLKARDSGGTPCQRVYELAKGKLNTIVGDIEALKRTEKYLRKILTDWELRLDRAGRDQKSHLLYSLSTVPVNSGDSGKKFGRKKRP